MGKDNLSGKKKYTNGNISKFFFPGTEPEGWKLGSTEEFKRKVSEGTKKAMQRPEVKEKFIKAMQNEELRAIRSLNSKKSWENPDIRKSRIDHISKSNKEYYNSEEGKLMASNRTSRLWEQEDYKKSQTEAIQKGHKDLYINHPEYKDKLSDSNKKAWNENKENILTKQYTTKKKNNSFNTSRLEEDYYQTLLHKYDKDDIIRQYSVDERYPFNCDFYIKSEDKFIELQGTWCHGGHPFDAKNESDIKILNEWKEKAKISDYFKSAIHIWTETDPLKIKIAKENNLNIEFIY